jgi:hypothetical protein
MNSNYKIIILLLFLFFTEGVVAQRRFRATALAGLNLSQIDGDRQDGYRKAGLSLGLNGGIYINPAFDISTELLYNQRGAVPNKDFALTETRSKFSFQYGEVALLANFYLRPNAAKTYYQRSVHLGFSYGRLLKSSTSISVQNASLPLLETELLNKFNPQDVSFIIGWSQLFTERIGITIRHTSSISLLYKNPDYRINLEGFKYLRPYFLSFHVFYNLVSPNKFMGLKVKKKTIQDNPLEEVH